MSRLGATCGRQGCHGGRVGGNGVTIFIDGFLKQRPDEAVPGPDSDHRLLQTVGITEVSVGDLAAAFNRMEKHRDPSTVEFRALGSSGDPRMADALVELSSWAARRLARGLCLWVRGSTGGCRPCTGGRFRPTLV